MSVFKDIIKKAALERIRYLEKNPDKVTEEDQKILEKIYSSLCKVMGISESGKWCINWTVEKFKDRAAYESGTPYETRVAAQNVILDNGANYMLKIIGGIDEAVPFSNKNAMIGVGKDSTPENASQTKLQDSSAFYKKVESGYPQVSGRTIVYKATFDTSEANFAWNEFSIVNGDGVGGVALNRKVQSLGTKVTGIWSLQITISVTSNS